MMMLKDNLRANSGGGTLKTVAHSGWGRFLLMPKLDTTNFDIQSLSKQQNLI